MERKIKYGGYTVEYKKSGKWTFLSHHKDENFANANAEVKQLVTDSRIWNKGKIIKTFPKKEKK